MIEPMIAACISLAAAQYDLPPAILGVLRKVEAGQVGTVSRNDNGSHDLGVMQINDRTWLPRLSRHYNVQPARVRDRLINDACFNVQVAAWILKSEIVQAGDFWTGVVHYHSRNPRHKARYLRMAVNAAIKLYGPGVFARPGEAPAAPVALEEAEGQVQQRAVAPQPQLRETIPGPAWTGGRQAATRAVAARDRGVMIDLHLLETIDKHIGSAEMTYNGVRIDQDTIRRGSQISDLAFKLELGGK